MQQILLIDNDDIILGKASKEDIHHKGLLHRAFSVFIINSNNEILLQQRAVSKYHSGGLWSNTCCGHFTSEINLAMQAEQRLQEEMGIRAQLQWIFNYQYMVRFENGLTENELVYTYLGFYDGDPLPDPQEAEKWRWIKKEKLITEMQQHPEHFTYWFKFVIDKFFQKLKDIQLG